MRLRRPVSPVLVCSPYPVGSVGKTGGDNEGHVVCTLVAFELTLIRDGGLGVARRHICERGCDEGCRGKACQEVAVKTGGEVKFHGDDFMENVSLLSKVFPSIRHFHDNASILGIRVNAVYAAKKQKRCELQKGGDACANAAGMGCGVEAG